MANNLSNAYQSGLMFQVFFNQSMQPPATIAVALTTVPPNNLTFTEAANAGGYARQTVGLGINNWTYQWIGSGVMYNKSTITFPVATADWGWISGAQLVDSATYGAGTGIFYTTLTTPKNITINDQFYIPPSGLFVRMQ